MTEKELIGKIRELRQIKPSQDWVALTKSQILGEEKKYTSLFFFPIFRPAYAGLPAKIFRKTWAGLIVVFVLFGLFGFSQNSLPGDLLYPIKKITESGQAVFVSEKDGAKLQLELANKRLEELNKIAEANQVKNLAPAINEFQKNLSQAAKKISEAKKPDVKKILAETKKLEENKEKVEALGIVVGESEEFDNALAQLVEREIEDLEGRTLSEEQKEILAEAKEDFEAGNYSEALTKILILTQP